MKHKNDYSCIVYFPTDKPKKWEYVHGLRGFANFLTEKHSNWLYFNVYERRTRNYLKRFYNGSIVPQFLGLLGFLLSPFFFLTFNKPTLNNLTFINGIYKTATIPNLW